jgi:hypothetical protein
MFLTKGFANQDTVKIGSFIINMGVSPQTYGNGLKPYGLLYDLLKNHKIPVWWIINPSKAKDGIDFTHNGTNYRGGTLIIPAQFRTPAINTTIANWQAQGVVGATTVSQFVIDIFMTLRFAPHWTLDKDNGSIAVNFFTNAGIPSAAYGGSSPLGWKTPAELDACDDLFVMPHADPTWATHNNLYYWNQNFKGNIWAGCHAVSVLENTTDPTGTIKMNFLTTNGMVLYSAHGNGAKPFSYINPTDPVMQFIGTMDNAVSMGSEQQFLPSLSSAWRASSTIGVYASVHPNIPALSAGLAASNVYGRGFGDTNRGYVMYQGGHDINMGAFAERVAAERTFFNFSFYATTRTRDFDVDMSGAPPVGLINNSYNLSFTVPSYIDLSPFTIKWTSTGTGSFSPDDHSQNVTYVPTGSPGRTDQITVSLTDGCGRVFAASNVTFMSGVLATNTIQLRGEKKSTERIELNWSTAEKNIDYFELQKNENNAGFKSVKRIVAQETGTHQSYTASDNDFNDVLTLYRLRIVDLSGKISYSTTIKFNGSLDHSALQFSLQGNPVRKSIKLLNENGSTQQISISMWDMQGKMLLTKSSEPGSYNDIIFVDLPANISRGQYLVKINSAGQQKTLKVIIQ